MSKVLVIHTAVILTAPWWWVIVTRDIWTAFLVLILSFALVFWMYEKQSKKLFVCVLVLTLFLSIISLKQAYDESILRTSALEIQQFNRRHEFYANGLGKLYTNRFSLNYFKNFDLPIYNLKRNLFENLDINLYFFGNHPRERAGVEEFEKYIPILLPFFIVGFIHLFLVLKKGIIFYVVIISIVSATISPFYNLGPILFFPVINLIITIGTSLSLAKIPKIIKGKR